MTQYVENAQLEREIELVNKTLNISGIDKEVIAAKVIEPTGILKIYFEDMTSVMVSGVKIIVAED